MTETAYELRCVCCAGFIGEVFGLMPEQLRVRCPVRSCRCWMLFQGVEGRVVVSRWFRAISADKPGNMVE